MCWCSRPPAARRARSARIRWPPASSPSSTAPSTSPAVPALSICNGFSETGLPLSLQIGGRPFEDALVLRSATPWSATLGTRTRRPALTKDPRVPWQLSRLRHRDLGEIHEPALHRHEALNLLRHRARVQVMHDEQPGRLIDDLAVRLGQKLRLFRRVESGLRLFQQVGDLRRCRNAPSCSWWARSCPSRSSGTWWMDRPS